MADQGKNIFQKAVDALSSRDEKEAAETAAKEAAQQKAVAASAMAEAARQKAAAEEAKKKAADAEAAMAKMEADKHKAEVEAKASILADSLKAAGEKMLEKKFIAEHKLTSSETLSHLSLKYYGSAVRDYWMVIYEANKDVIGPNPALVVPGMVLKIPVLPPNLPMKK